MRFLLGAPDAGFFPGVVLYLSYWCPVADRGRAITQFYFAYPLASVLMGSIAGPLLALDGHVGLHGWQWLFVIEGLPAIAMSVLILWLLPDGPASASWLTDSERGLLTQVSANRTHQRLIETLSLLGDRRVLLFGG